jgi:2-aminoethylphosphonate dioxygenase
MLSPRNDLRYGLTAAERDDWQERGWVILRGRFSADEVARWREDCEAVQQGQRLPLDPDNLRFAQWQRLADGREVPWKIDPVLDLAPALAGLARDRRITDALASIYDGYPPRLFKDKLIVKPPGGKGSVRHQDYNWWQGFPPSLLSVAVAIDASTAQQGCTRLATGWRRGFLHGPAGQIGPEIPAEVLAGETWTDAVLQPGDCAVFHCLTPHAAEANRSASSRRVLFLSYNDSRDGEHYQAHADHYLGYIGKDLPPERRARAYFR